MHCTIDRLTLHGALKRAMLALPGKAARGLHDATSHVHMEAQDTTLCLTCTDLATTVQIDVPCTIVNPGLALIPAQLLMDCLGALPDGNLDMATDTRHHVQITMPRRELRLFGADPADYPMPPTLGDGVGLRMSSAVLAEALGLVSFATSDDASRPALTGARLHAAEGMASLAAADGYRAAVRQITMLDVAAAVREIVLPGSVLPVLGKLLVEGSMVALRITDSHCSVTMDGVRVTTALVGATYPDINRIIPASSTVTATVNRAELLRALRLVQHIDDSDVAKASLSVELGASKRASGTLTVVGVVDRGSTTTILDATATIEDVAHTTITVNVRYALDVIRALDTELVTVAMRGASQPLLLHGGGQVGYNAIVMPLHR